MSFVVHRVAKSAARYTDAGGREKCGYCRFFVAPRACGKVIGPVSPAGWCKYFSRQVAQQYSGAGISGGGGPPGTTLDLNFMSSGNMPAGVTFTRASPASYQDASGVIQTAAVDQPRWDYAGGSLRGLLIEEARTNLLLNSATLGTQSVAVTAQAYTLSFYGTGTVTKSGAATGALVGTGAGQRVTQTFTPTAGTLTCTVTGSVTNAQIEAGSFGPTSWIPTAGATATRAKTTFVTMPTNAGWYNQSEPGRCFHSSLRGKPIGRRRIGIRACGRSTTGALIAPMRSISSRSIMRRHSCSQISLRPSPLSVNKGAVSVH